MKFKYSYSGNRELDTQIKQQRNHKPAERDYPSHERGSTMGEGKIMKFERQTMGYEYAACMMKPSMDVNMRCMRKMHGF